MPHRGRKKLMKYTVRQRVFTIGAKYDITDTDGNPVYYVEGEIISLGRVLHIYDMQGSEAALIEQRLFTFGRKYDVSCRGTHCVTISKTPFTFFGSHYTIEGTDWEVEGAPMSHEFSVIDGAGRIVASISKKWFTWGDCYLIDVPAEDSLMGLAVVLAIDAVIDSSDN